jgi:hypothetical protein
MAGETNGGVAFGDSEAWLTPEAAVGILEDAYDSNQLARNTLLTRLRSGMVHAVALSTRVDNGALRQNLVIPRDHWDGVEWHNNVFVTGDLEYTTGSYGSRGHMRWSRFGVFLNRAEVEEIVDPQRRTSQNEEPQVQEPEEQVEEPQPAATSELKPVSQAALQAWYEAYKLAYGGTAQDTLPFALASAKGAFPDRRISRETIRKLAGGRKRGPKQSPEGNQ